MAVIRSTRLQTKQNRLYTEIINYRVCSTFLYFRPTYGAFRTGLQGFLRIFEYRIQFYEEGVIQILTLILVYYLWHVGQIKKKTNFNLHLRRHFKEH